MEYSNPAFECKNANLTEKVFIKSLGSFCFYIYKQPKCENVTLFLKNFFKGGF